MDAAAGQMALLASNLQTVRLFDYILTVELEVSLMWSSNWSLPKLLFFLSRYSPLFDVPMLLYYSMVSGLSFEKCSQLHAGASWGTVFGIAIAEAILILRTYALSGGRRGVLICFTAIWIVAILSSIVFLVLFLQSVTYGPPPLPNIPGCSLVAGNVVFASIPFIIVLLNDTVIMAYTLWIGLANYRYSRNPLIVALYRDGITYYLFLCIVSAVNVAALLQAPKSLAQLFNTFLRVLHSVLSTRILLHVREIEKIESERALALQQPVILSFAVPDSEVLE
ncbi:hypothetical protein DFH07DRAFT_951039 [Mycena maculata]|uniref:DUF6533 domain-containing protein n=1 Tax=Mycena maculata TaxID=230809 RepID=A0AAD7K425_9AGAR|nr:hypothetical protein DFH07DRAFT_951039 [Mycena maculata]